MTARDDRPKFGLRVVDDKGTEAEFWYHVEAHRDRDYDRYAPLFVKVKKVDR